MEANQKQPVSLQNSLSEYLQPLPKPDPQEIKCILCARLMEDAPDQYVADLFLRGLEREDQRDKMFEHFTRKETTIQYQGQEWPTVLRMASLSILELWTGPLFRLRFKEADAIVLVVSLNNKEAFYWFCGVDVVEGTLELDRDTSPQLARVLVATYADPAPETWAVREEQVPALAKSFRAELVLMPETDLQRGNKIMEDVAKKVIALRVEDGRRREEEEARNASLNIQLDFN